MTDNPTPQSDEDPFEHVGWWCWRGDNHGHLATTACRSDNVPIHVPADWADEMRAVIQRIEDGGDEQPPAVPASSPPPDQTDLRARIAEALAPYFANFSDWETARINAGEAAVPVLAVLPPPADRAAVIAATARACAAHLRDRYSDTWTEDAARSLELNAARIERGEPTALLRRLAAEAQQPDTDGCPDPIECSHEAALGEAQQQVKRLSLMVDEYGHGASALTDKLKRARDMHRETCPWAQGGAPSPAFKCGMCEVLDAPAVPVQPAADGSGEEARVVRCSRAILSRPHEPHGGCPGFSFTEEV
ncbi:hypothetical protein [Streptomyces sp. NPDC001492]